MGNSTDSPGRDENFFADDILAGLEAEVAEANKNRQTELSGEIKAQDVKIEKVRICREEFELFELNFDDALPGKIETLFGKLEAVFTEVQGDAESLKILSKLRDYLRAQYERMHKLCDDSPKMAEKIEANFFGDEKIREQFLTRAGLFKSRGVEVLAEVGVYLGGQRDTMLAEMAEIDGFARSLDRPRFPANPESLEVRKALFERRIAEMLKKRFDSKKDDFGPDILALARQIRYPEWNWHTARWVYQIPDEILRKVRVLPAYMSKAEACDEKIKYVTEVVIPMLAKEFVRKAEELELAKVSDGEAKGNVLTGLYDRTDLDLSRLESRYDVSSSYSVYLDKGSTVSGRTLNLGKKEDARLFEKLTELEVLLSAVFSGVEPARVVFWNRLEDLFAIGVAGKRWSEAEQTGQTSSSLRQVKVDMPKDFYHMDVVRKPLLLMFNESPEFFARFQAMLNVGKDLPDDGVPSREVHGDKNNAEASLRKTLVEICSRVNAGGVHYFEGKRTETKDEYRRVAAELSRQADLAGVKAPILTMEDARREVDRFEGDVTALRERLIAEEEAKIGGIRDEAGKKVIAALGERDTLSQELAALKGQLDGFGKTFGSTSLEKGSLAEKVDNLVKDLGKLNKNKAHTMASLKALKKELSDKITELNAKTGVFGRGKRAKRVDEYDQIIASIDAVLRVLDAKNDSK